MKATPIDIVSREKNLAHLIILEPKRRSLGNFLTVLLDDYIKIIQDIPVKFSLTIYYKFGPSRRPLIGRNNLKEYVLY